MKIACIYLCDFKDRKDYYLSLMPYGITSIASFLENEGHEVILANLSSYGYKKAAEIIINLKPDAVAISIFSFNRTDSFKFIKELKKLNKSIIIIIGGQHPTFLYDEILTRFPEIDFIITGEGEYSIKRLIDASFKNIPKVIKSERIKDIDSIPTPSYFNGRMIGINPAEQFKFIITSRGCPAYCTYCSSPAFWENKVTYRSPQSIVDELEFIQDKYGIIYFSIRDDNFTLKKNRVMEFCRILEKSRLYMMWNCQARVDSIDEEMLVAMKKCGLEHIQFGVESGSEKILKIYDKRITPEKIKNAAKLVRKVGVYLSFYLMTGMIGENEDDVKATEKLISATMPHDVIISPVAYYPGTKIYSESCKKGLIDDTRWFISTDNGLYVSPKKFHEKNIKDLLKHSSKISSNANYTKQDLLIQKTSTGQKCWMNYIIEADFYLRTHNINKLITVYDEMINQYPDNKWGYLRLADIIIHDLPQKAISLLNKAAELSPSFYGTWYLIALIYFETGRISDADKNIRKAIKLNPFDPEITTLSKKIIKSKKQL